MSAHNKLVNAAKQTGFILTMELMIILTVLGIGLMVGVFAVREAVFKYYVTQQSKEVYVSDANGTNLGQAIGFDEHEAPLLVYVDRSQDENYRALVGVRDDRFTTREPVYYTLPSCQGDPCMKRPSREDHDNQGVDYLPGTGAVSYLYALQGGPTYGVGAGTDDRIKGNLYRSEPEACDVDIVTAVLGSRWISQKVVNGEPCEPFVLPLPVDTVPLYCPSSTPAVSVCDVNCTTGTNSCSCPSGYDTYNLSGDAQFCCPAGQSFNGDLENPLCEGDGLVRAEPVISLRNPGGNVLDDFLSPFSVNLPIDAGADSWNYIPPDTEDGTELN